MKKFAPPKMEIVCFSVEDVISTSGRDYETEVG